MPANTTRVSAAVILWGLVLLGCAPSAWAQCPRLTVEQMQKLPIDTVLHGVVREVSGPTATFDVDRIWKGPRYRRVIVVPPRGPVITSEGNFDFRVGKSYYIGGKRMDAQQRKALNLSGAKDPVFETDDCLAIEAPLGRRSTGRPPR